MNTPFNLITTLGNYCSAGTGLNTCLQALYNLIVAFAVVLAFIMFFIGAFKNLLSSIPDIKMEGKKQMRNSLIGLAVIFASGVLFYWINPEIFNAKLIIYRVEFSYPEIEDLTDTDVKAAPLNPLATSSIKISGKKEEIVSWRELFPLGLSHIIPANNDNGTEWVNKNLKEVLIKFNEELKKRDIKIILTDGYSPQEHKSAGHTKYGTAIDVVPFKKTSDAWTKVYEAAINTPFCKIINETGFSITLSNGKVVHPRTFAHTTGPHLHLEACYEIQK